MGFVAMKRLLPSVLNLNKGATGPKDLLEKMSMFSGHASQMVAQRTLARCCCVPRRWVILPLWQSHSASPIFFDLCWWPLLISGPMETRRKTVASFECATRASLKFFQRQSIVTPSWINRRFCNTRRFGQRYGIWKRIAPSLRRRLGSASVKHKWRRVAQPNPSRYVLRFGAHWDKQ